jgi:2-hydroxychromene-2-carboxylate isomerase
MAADSIDVWFTMGSTYTYLTVARLEGLAKAAGVAVRWRPLRNVMVLTGATQLPFLEGTAKLRYMWRDIERRAAKYGLPIRLPVPYPVPDSARANRVALIGMREGWGPAYMRAAYRLWFAQGLGNGDEENLRASLTECGQGQEIDRILALADSEEIVGALEQQTDEARHLGVFGAPTFVARGELFWGDDHLEDALHWALHGRL